MCKGPDRADKERRIPRQAGGFGTADRPQGRIIHSGKNTEKMIRLPQSLRHGSGREIVADRHADPRPTGGGGSFPKTGRNAIVSGGGGQHRKTDAVRVKSGEIYHRISAKKNASHTGMP